MTIDTQKLLEDHGSIAPLSPTRLECLDVRALQQLDYSGPGSRGKSIYVGANEVLELVAAARALADAQNAIDAQTAEIARLRDGIEEAIRLLGMDRPIDPTDTLRAVASGGVMTSKLVPTEPTPEMMAAAAMAVLAPAAADMSLARQAAMIVMRQTCDLQDCMTLEHMAATIATMAPAYRAMIGAAQEQGGSDD